jgi:thiamine biosynthesis lipoprotein
MRSFPGGVALALLAGCILPDPPGLTRFEFVESHMATPCEIKLYAPTEEAASLAAKEAYAEIAAIDDSMNDYRPESEISRLSATAGLDGMVVSQRLYDVLEASLRYSALSDGAFDITVGPIVQLWRRARRGRMPEREELAVELARVGWRKLHLDPATRTARLSDPWMALDVGGIAKGYACDRALAILKRRGLTRALVNTGGGMAFGDPPPGKIGWSIQLADTEDVLLLANCGVATSGDWERFVVIEGRRYSHIVDPKTGLGLTNRALVTVVAPTGIAADALTKCVMIPGVERGMRLVESLPGVQAWMRWEVDGQIRTAQTTGFTGLLRR